MTGLDIAMIGTRGLPATFGGVERHVEEIGHRLVLRGHRVTVYSEKGYGATDIEVHRGMHVVPVSVIHTKNLEALTHSVVSTVLAMRRQPDVMHFHAVGPGVLTPVPRAFSKAAVVQTIHGLDADRAKWGGTARKLLQGGTWLSARVPHRTITVSEALRDYYAGRYNRACVAIPNGITPQQELEPSIIERNYGLGAGDYILYVGRLVPEKRPDLLLQAFAKIDTDLKLVLVGGSSYTDGYVTYLEDLAAADPRVILPGYVYGAELAELFTNAACFVQPSELEGMPLTLLEAIGSGLPVVVSDIAPHVDLVGGNQPGARMFRVGDSDHLRAQITLVLENLGTEHEAAATLAQKALRDFDWDRCAEATEAVYLDAIRLRDEVRHSRSGT